MAQVSWSEFANQEGTRSRDGIRNLKLVTGNTYVVRFVGDPWKYHKYFINNRSAICEDPNKCSVRERMNIEPNTRFACNVLDRNESVPENRLKLMDVPPSVLKPVVAWWKARKADPGGAKGCDFHIEVTGQKKQTRYHVTALEVTPFTEEEKEYIRANIYNLEKLHKPTPDNEIIERLGLNTPGAGAERPAERAERTEERPLQRESGVSKSADGVDLPF